MAFFLLNIGGEMPVTASWRDGRRNHRLFPKHCKAQLNAKPELTTEEGRHVFSCN